VPPTGGEDPASTDQQAASMMLKGMTAQYLLRRTYPVKPGDTILFHAAAGGVGLILCQWAKHLGATVIGTVGSVEKATLARANGCDHVINYRTEDFVARVAEITGGKKCAVVYDGVGKDTFMKSLDCLRPRRGPGLGSEPGLAAAPAVTRRRWTHMRTSGGTANELFDVVGRGIVKLEINQTYALKDAVQAHRDLEARKTTGSTVLLP
jgi:NADPH2:quinone reductase